MLTISLTGGNEVNKVLADLYNNVSFKDEHIKMIADNIRAKEEAIKVLELIKENTKHPSRPDGPGITKEKIQSSIKVKSKKYIKDKNKFQNAVINMSRPMCDNIINFLSGATLIYYEESQERGKFYHLTSRGTFVYAYLIKQGVVKK